MVCNTPRRRVAALLGAAFVLEEILINFGGNIGAGGAGGRYAAIPVAILSVAVVHAAAAATRLEVRLLARFVCGVVVVAGLANFWTNTPSILRCQRCPDWGREVEAYQSGATTRLTIWPYVGKLRWTLVLPRARPRGHAEIKAAPATQARTPRTPRIASVSARSSTTWSAPAPSSAARGE